MKSLGSLTGCALALACAHEGKGVVGSDTNLKGTVAAEASQPQADSTADASTAAIRPFHVNVPDAAELGYEVTVVRDATASYSDEEMHAALDINIPNYAGAIVTTDQVVDSLSSVQTPVLAG